MTEEQAAFARQVADDILHHKDWYNQGTWIHAKCDHHSCGTPACVAGFATFRVLQQENPDFDPEALRIEMDCLHQKSGRSERGRTVRSIAKDALGLSSDQASGMFHPDPYGGGELPPSPDEAAEMLHHYANEADVWWPDRRQP